MAEFLSDENFNEKVKGANGTVMVDFFATWCGPCKMIGPVVEQFAKEYEGRAAIYKLDVEDAAGTAMSYGVRGVPTLIFFRNGEETERIVGAPTKDELREALERNING